MKKLLFLFILFVGFGAVLVSCKSDDEELKNLGTMVIDDVEYTINKATVRGYRSTNGNKNNDYVFTFTSINGNDTSREVVLAISYPYNDLSMNGQYLLAGSAKRLDQWISHYAMTYGKHTDTYNNLQTGKCTVARLELNKFKVTFDFVPQSGQKVKGAFEGDVELSEVDY